RSPFFGQPTTVANPRKVDLTVGLNFSPSDDGNLDVVDRRQRIEQALPLFAAFSANPELAGRRAEVERRRLEPIDVHRIAQNGEVALLFRQPARESVPRGAAILATPHCRCTAGTGARCGL